MKNKLLSALAVLSFLAFTGCSDDDSSDNFNGVNGDTAKRYITKVVATANEESLQTETLIVTYNADGTVNTASDGTETNLFSYEGGELTTITGSGDNLIVNDVMNTVYDGYEVGEVLEYDNAGNPTKLRLFERDYDGSIYASYTATITYDAKPNPYFYTLEAAGIIDVLDNVELNFSMTPQAEEIVLAKKLLPVNNPSKVIIRDEDTNEVTGQVTAVYQYNSDNYPVIVEITEKDRYNDIYTYTAAYTYKQ
ncbi:hypothetical protein E0W68_10055 [Flavobacterium salilacus subsp. salilacus]|uniref:hypothetical protein n=1 Tax=Flavobacterium TaxID=237 RepID=UPI00107549E2|nr:MULTISPECIES: hypothetical protein [Flavobacterium]KAF2518355.1 hypothetical protein E0W68_10055 [Flavobacterium salilacus subsp. salilacus]MBE1615230.1 hypothetical protein [Flavobacterium sp. SaA2.13]